MKAMMMMCIPQHKSKIEIMQTAFLFSNLWELMPTVSQNGYIFRRMHYIYIQTCIQIITLSSLIGRKLLAAPLFLFFAPIENNRYVGACQAATHCT
jgi:hypothetical protein